MNTEDDVFQLPKLVHGRRQYVCCECGAKIWEHDQHELFSGKFRQDSPRLAVAPDDDELDGDGRAWRTFRTCLACVNLREELSGAEPLKRGGLAAECVRRKPELAAKPATFAGEVIKAYVKQEASG